jgi:hypothetical protein
VALALPMVDQDQIQFSAQSHQLAAVVVVALAAVPQLRVVLVAVAEVKHLRLE